MEYSSTVLAFIYLFDGTYKASSLNLILTPLCHHFRLVHYAKETMSHTSKVVLSEFQDTNIIRNKVGS